MGLCPRGQTKIYREELIKFLSLSICSITAAPQLLRLGATGQNSRYTFRWQWTAWAIELPPVLLQVTFLLDSSCFGFISAEMFLFLCTHATVSAHIYSLTWWISMMVAETKGNKEWPEWKVSVGKQRAAEPHHQCGQQRSHCWASLSLRDERGSLRAGTSYRSPTDPF